MFHTMSSPFTSPIVMILLPRTHEDDKLVRVMVLTKDRSQEALGASDKITILSDIRRTRKHGSLQGQGRQDRPSRN